MFQNLIKERVKNLTIEDIDKFAKENNIFLENEELNNILDIIQNNWYGLIYGNAETIFSSNRSKIGTNNYSKIKELFDFFKKKYQNFL